MRTTPALALIAAILASSAIEVLASPSAGHASAKLHRRTCAAGQHGKRDTEAVLPEPYSAATTGDDHHKKMHKKKSKGHCAVKHDAHSGHSKGGDQAGSVPQITVTPPVNDQTPAGDAPLATGSPIGKEGPGSGSEKNGASAGGSVIPATPAPDSGSQSGTSSATAFNPGTDAPLRPVGYGAASQPNPSSSGASGEDPKDKSPPSDDLEPASQPEGYSSNSRKYDDLQGAGLLCKGIKGSSKSISSDSAIKPNWFSPDLIHHGPGTQFGGAGLWEGGACMLDSLPHANLPSIAMDQSFFQDGLACGTCVEIASTSASLFSNSATWSVEEPKRGTLPAGKKTVAIVSDLCPGVNQCFSGLDMHLDAWNSVTSNANGSKLPVNWRFVNCKEAFESSKSGIKKLQVHWRPGSNPGFFQVQIRGSHEAVIKVEMKWGKQEWMTAGHVDSSWWKWDLKNTAEFDQSKTAVAFRITDWQGQTITSEISTLMGKDLFFDANFEAGSQRA